MSKNYTKEHYAINKYRKGIVYRGVDGNYEITMEGFLQENPNMTEADFDYWKALSDELYKEEGRKSNEITRMNVSIGDIEETQLVSVESAETEFVRSISEEDIFKMEIMSALLILRIAREELSDIQLRRFLSYYILSDKMRKLSPEMLRIVENIIDECVKI